MGWFPGNHVEEISPGTIVLVDHVSKFPVAESNFQGSKELADNNRDSLQRYYDLVVKDIIDSEEIYVSELVVRIFVRTHAPHGYTMALVCLHTDIHRYLCIQDSYIQISGVR